MAERPPKPGEGYRRGVRLNLTVSPQVSNLLDRLLATGMYGRNRAHVAQGLLYKAARETLERPRFSWNPRTRRYE